eukprot:2853984-Alexandrium_andersonii.AAC.1
MMASLSLLPGSLRGPPWPSSGQLGSACATSARRARGGTKAHVQTAQLHACTSAAQNVLMSELRAQMNSARRRSAKCGGSGARS